MNAKEYLSQIPALDRYITMRLEHHEVMKEAANRTTCVISDMPHAPGRDPFKREKQQVAVIDDARELNELTDKYINLVHEATDIINAIEADDARMKVVLSRKYIRNKNWVEIAEELNLTERHVKRLHGRALAAMDRVLDGVQITECHEMS